MKRRELVKLMFSAPLVSSLPLSTRANQVNLNKHRTLVEAHRGNSISAPENTMEAFEQAIEIGVDRVELDLRLSKDNKLVVIHDDTVDRTTNGSGVVSQMNFKTIASLDAGSWKDEKYKGAKVPLLHEVFELCKHKTIVNIDLKSAKAVPYMVKAILDMNMEDHVVITGKIPQCTEAIRNEGGFITMFYENSPAFKKQLHAQNNIQAIHTAVKEAREKFLPGFLFKAAWITPEIVRIAHLHGLAVNVWDVNNKETLTKMTQANVDSIMTDDPALMNDLLKSI
jgi:glycerophosphoryl diester phosphodiesterase